MLKTRRFERIGSMEEFVYRFSIRHKILCRNSTISSAFDPDNKAINGGGKQGKIRPNEWKEAKKQSLRNGSDILETISQCF